MEKLRIVHALTNRPTGVLLNRNEAIASKAWCRSTNVFILNSKGEVLCHKRSTVKERLPGVWVTHLGGHVNDQETYETNALKEIYEEAGIVVGEAELIPWRTSPIEGARLWVRDFALYYDKPIHTFTPQVGEVDEFRWMEVEEILEAEKRNSSLWCAGTHNFRLEYVCMRAVLTAAHNLGIVKLPHSLQIFHSLSYTT